MEQYDGIREDSGRLYRDGELARRQLKKLVWSTVVLALCTGLYYLGFFGTAEGPLNPEKIGTAVGRKGFGRSHLLITMIAIFIISATWNWAYNLLNRIRILFALSATRSGQDLGKGYRRSYRPLRKGVWGHAAWVAALMALIGVAIQL